MAGGDGGRGLRVGSSILGSLRDALAAAGRDDSSRALAQPDTAPSDDAFAAMKDVTHALDDASKTTLAAPLPPPVPAADPDRNRPPRAVEAARDARGGTPNVPVVDLTPDDDVPPTTGVLREPIRGGAPRAAAPAEADETARTQLVRGKQKVARGDFKQDPVVGWLVIIGGAGLGAFRPIFEGNNTVGRSATNRIAIDFGDETISNEEQAYIRYDSADRSFLFVPNLAKTNVVSVNDKRPAQPVRLVAMDLITMGRTQLVFVPFCGADFDWGDLSELNR